MNTTTNQKCFPWSQSCDPHRFPPKGRKTRTLGLIPTTPGHKSCWLAMGASKLWVLS